MTRGFRAACLAAVMSAACATVNESDGVLGEEDVPEVVDDAGAPDDVVTGDDVATEDAGPTDAGSPDAGPTDGGPTDAGSPDAGPMDGGPTDAGSPDAGPTDVGPRDSGPIDAGPRDTGPVDTGPPPECAAGATRACYSGPSATRGRGACRDGVERCSAGRWSGRCEGETLPMAAETCNNVDDDCDGMTDESLARDCYGGPSGTRDVGVCRGGTQTCAAGAWGACAGEVRPAATETCGDGDDDTCDGRVDEGCVSRPNFALGNVSACWLDESDRAYCWGGNFYGMTAYSTTSGSGTAARTPELDGLTLAAGEYFNCVLRAGGTVWCAGLNTEGQLGDNSTTNRMSPVQAQGVTGATAIAGGYKHACAVVAGGAVRCWGMNGRNQLGAATSTMCGAQACSRAAVAVPGVTGATQLALGYAHSCALRSDGTVWCWGDNTYGQMGRGAMGTSVVSPGAVPGLTGVRAIEGGYNHTCALMGDGTVRCWGQNSYGQLGDGTMDTRTSPVQVQGLRGVEQIAVGFYHGCARAAGGLSCWGYNTYGQVGNGTTVNSRTPSTVPLTGITDVGTGYWHTCARSTGTTIWCWGWNLANMLGTGDTTPSQSGSPLRVVF